MLDEWVVTQALDKAIEKVIRDEITSLFNKMTDQEKTFAVCGALKELDDLAYGFHPRYSNPMTALLYISWYQPKQINLIYAAIKQTLNLRKDDSLVLDNGGRLNIADFGCGALATQFAVAFAIADALERNESISVVRIKSYDTSKPMIELGKKIWRRFQLEVSREPSLNLLSEAMGKIKSRSSTAKTIFIGGNDAGDNWLSAIHTVYDDNWDPVKNQLAEITKDKNPDIGIITSFASKRQLVDVASPFGDRMRGRISDASPNFAFLSILPELTSLRRSIRKQLHEIVADTGIPLPTDRRGQDITWFLDTSVDWQFRPVVCQTYIKQ